jgi:hypothetical protein
MPGLNIQRFAEGFIVACICVLIGTCTYKEAAKDVKAVSAEGCK